MSSTAKPFFLVNKQEEVNGDIRLGYGAGDDDPKLFFLTVTPAYVAGKSKRSSVNCKEILDYIECNAHELRQLAIKFRVLGHPRFTLR